MNMVYVQNILKQENKNSSVITQVKILSDKKIPSVFKTGLITPVPKKGKDQNYLKTTEELP